MAQMLRWSCSRGCCQRTSRQADDRQWRKDALDEQDVLLDCTGCDGGLYRAGPSGHEYWVGCTLCDACWDYHEDGYDLNWKWWENSADSPKFIGPESRSQNGRRRQQEDRQAS